MPQHGKPGAGAIASGFGSATLVSTETGVVIRHGRKLDSMDESSGLSLPKRLPAGPDAPAARSVDGREPRLPSTEIRRITRAMARSDEAAFNRFYAAYFDRMYRYLLVMTGGRDDLAREVLQDAMLRVVRYVKPFHEESDLWNWLRRVTRTAFLDAGRTRRSDDAIVAPVRLDALAPDPPDPESALVAHLEACVSDLPDDERAMVRGKYENGESYHDLAGRLGTTAKAVESRLARIRKKLKSMILRRLSHEETT